MAKLKLDLHDIYNKGHMIEKELNRVMQEAVDKRILPVNPHPHLESAVVISQGRGLLHWMPSLLLTPGLRLHH